MKTLLFLLISAIHYNALAQDKLDSVFIYEIENESLKKQLFQIISSYKAHLEYTDGYYIMLSTLKCHSDSCLLELSSGFEIGEGHVFWGALRIQGLNILLAGPYFTSLKKTERSLTFKLTADSFENAEIVDYPILYVNSSKERLHVLKEFITGCE